MESKRWWLPEKTVCVELVEWILEKSRTQLMVLSSDICTNNGETGELAEDLLAIVTVFVV